MKLPLLADYQPYADAHAQRIAAHDELIALQAAHVAAGEECRALAASLDLADVDRLPAAEAEREKARRRIEIQRNVLAAAEAVEQAALRDAKVVVKARMHELAATHAAAIDHAIAEIEAAAQQLEALRSHSRRELKENVAAYHVAAGLRQGMAQWRSEREHYTGSATVAAIHAKAHELVTPLERRARGESGNVARRR